MATTFCDEHGAYDGDQCPGCLHVLQKSFQDEPVVETESLKELVCSDCGEVLHSGVNFCPNCGSRVKKAAKKTEPLFRTVRANTLILSKMLADVVIKPTRDNSITIEVDGDEKIKKKVRIEEIDDEVRISAPLPFVKGGPSVDNVKNTVFGNDFSYTSVTITRSVYSGSVQNNQVIINGSEVDMERKLSILIEAPLGTDIKIGEMEGSCQIGKIQGNLFLNTSSSPSISAEQVNFLDATIRGGGLLKISRVTGIAIVSGSGSADVEIGNLEGKFNLTMGGSGDVDIGNVASELANLHVTGSGEITIGSGKIDWLSVVVTGSGDVEFDGTVIDATLKTTGSGDIVVNEVISSLQKSQSGSGDIVVSKAPKSSKGFSNW